MSERSRIVNISPTSGPVWGVFAHVEEVDAGRHYSISRIFGLALVEFWERTVWGEEEEPRQDRHRSICPIYLIDGCYFDVDHDLSDGEGAFTFLSELPKTQAEFDELEKEAVAHLHHLEEVWKAREAREEQKRMKNQTANK